MTSSPGSEPSTAAEPPAICPYLLVTSGHWRNAEPSRDHVCASEADAVQISLDTQRSLCFDDYGSCARFEEAARVYRAQVPLVPLRPIARTAPVVVERGRQPLPGPRLVDRRTLGQAALVVAMVAAAGALVLARSGGPTGGTAGRSPTPSTSSGGSVAGLTSASPRPTTQPSSPSPGASQSSPAKPSPSHTARPSPTHRPSGKTYQVKSGDTLSSIAIKFGTTVKVLSNLNGITDPKLIKPGQILKLP